MFKEATLVIHDKAIIDMGVGEPCCVEFDFLKIWNCIKKQGGLKRDSLHFFHTHSSNYSVEFFSSRDLECMKALNIGLGYCVNFWILTLEKGFSHFRFYDNIVNRLTTIPKNICTDDYSGHLVESIPLSTIDKVLTKLSLEDNLIVNICEESDAHHFIWPGCNRL